MDVISANPTESFLKESDLYFYGDNFWQAPLYKQVEGLNIEQALWRPAEGKHCIWQLVRHINYWKYWALKYAREGVMEEAKEHNWAPLPDEKTESNWKADVENLKNLHEEFKSVCSQIGSKLFDSKDENIVFLRTVLYHDAYHSGQIGTLRTLQNIKPVV
ncbi:MAG TPA: DinB family protein [Ignavibacteria bacterium]|nr:DinB family protein [Ignavibacteria bacterium]